MLLNFEKDRLEQVEGGRERFVGMTGTNDGSLGRKAARDWELGKTWRFFG